LWTFDRSHGGLICRYGREYWAQRGDLSAQRPILRDASAIECPAIAIIHAQSYADWTFRLILRYS
jgi:hypothetical protein